MKTCHLLASALLCAALASCNGGAPESKTLGIGVYPGNPAENFAPRIIPGGREYRNIALGRAAYHSSSWDYNLTAQLVTDGIIEQRPAVWMAMYSGDALAPKRERSYLTDMNVSSMKAEGPVAFFRIDFKRLDISADKVIVAGSGSGRVKLECSCGDGVWKEMGSARPVKTKGYVGENKMLFHDAEWTVKFPETAVFSQVRISLDVPAGEKASINELFFYSNGEPLDLNTNAFFVSNWKSEGCEDEWISVDLGADSVFDSLSFHWIFPPESGTIQVSADGKTWKDVKEVSSEEAFHQIKLPATKGRYVRAMLHNSVAGEPFELSEWEVFGRGGTALRSAPELPRKGTRQILSGGGWMIKRASYLDPDGSVISTDDYNPDGWMAATVPGTVLGSYVNAGAVPDPNYADGQFYASDSYFRSGFWYRRTFTAAADTEVQTLTFKGVNASAEVFLNGTPVGAIGSAFREHVFNVTGVLKDGTNTLAVKVHCNEHYGTAKEQNAYTPDKNGGVLGADNPTMHATIGWDWIPTVRGRDMGIYDEVRLDFRGPVILEDPFVRTELPLPDTSSAIVLAEAVMKNLSSRDVTGVLKFSFAGKTAEQEVTIPTKMGSKVEFASIELENPALWWPRGYGEQNLYRASFSFEENGTVSDSLSFLSGVRQMDCVLEPYEPQSTYAFTGRNDRQRLTMYVNGRRFIGFGGNWGFPEHLLGYRSREYDIAVGYHADMNFTMIRNWVGMTDSDAFYEACDRHGIMIWQDFWLANPWDGPDPLGQMYFASAAQQYVRRIRNHPSIAIYVGRNEGYPPEQIDMFLDAMVAQEHPGMLYIPHSAADGVSGGGPYWAMSPKEFFSLHGHDKMHSERGMPAVMNYENMARAMGEENLEPVNTVAHPNAMYGLHDYALGRVEGAAQQAESFNELIEKGFGEPADAHEFAALAQWINYDGYRAMFESRSEHRRGLLLWMSHPAWPSMVWQTYDYYLEPTAAYFGCKKACESVHIMLNPLHRTVEAVNWHGGNLSGLTASAVIFNLDGKEVLRTECPLDLPEDSTFECFPLELPADVPDVYFVRLKLHDSAGNLLSENFYWQGREEGNFKALRYLPEPKLQLSTTLKHDEDVYCFCATVRNAGSSPALMLRLKVTDPATGDLVLPVWYSDNYFFLMPGESRIVRIRVRAEDCRRTPLLQLESLRPSS